MNKTVVQQTIQILFSKDLQIITIGQKQQLFYIKNLWIENQKLKNKFQIIDMTEKYAVQQEIQKYQDRINNNNCLLQIKSISLFLVIHMIRSFFQKGYISYYEIICFTFQIMLYFFAQKNSKYGQILTSLNMIVIGWILGVVWPRYSMHSDTTFFVGLYMGILFTLFLSRSASAKYKTIMMSITTLNFWVYVPFSFERALNQYSIGIGINIIVAIYFYKSEAFEFSILEEYIIQKNKLQTYFYLLKDKLLVPCFIISFTDQKNIINLQFANKIAEQELLISENTKSNQIFSDYLQNFEIYTLEPQIEENQPRTLYDIVLNLQDYLKEQEIYGKVLENIERIEKDMQYKNQRYLMNVVCKMKLGKTQGFWSLKGIEHMTKKIDYYYYNISINPIIWQEKSCIFLTFTNISEKMLLNKYTQIEQYKDKIISSLSHELFTPLNGIKNSVEDAKKQIEQMSNQQKYTIQLLDQALVCGELLNILINSLMDYSLIRKGNFRLRNKFFKLNQSIKNVIELFKQTAQLKGIQIFILSEFDDDFQIYNDEQRLMEVLVNLFSNSVKFTQTGYAIIRVLKSIYNQNYVRIMILDSGKGMDQIELQNMFKLQIVNENSASHGLGFGTTIARFLINQIGPSGSVQVNSSLNQGTKIQFYIYREIDQQQIQNNNEDQYVSSEDFRESLLCKELDQQVEEIDEFIDNIFLIQDDEVLQNQESAIQVPRISNFIGSVTNYLEENKSQQQFSISKLSTAQKLYFQVPITQEVQLNEKFCGQYILLVDDTPFNLVVIQKHLRFLGFHVHIAEDGAQSIKKVEELYRQGKKYQIIFMDCNMPTMDGFQATEILKNKMNEHLIPYTPIIAVTACKTFSTQQKCKDVGMDDFLSKPCLKCDFDLMIQKWIEKSQQLNLSQN